MTPTSYDYSALLEKVRPCLERWTQEYLDHFVKCHSLEVATCYVARILSRYIPEELLLWNDCTIYRLARSAYLAPREERYARAAILADALEEAGYQGEPLLELLRATPGHGLVHVFDVLNSRYDHSSRSTDEHPTD